MTTKTKAKIMTFRQRLRADAEERLNKMVAAMRLEAAGVVKEAGSDINSVDLMRLISAGQTKSLHYRLVTELANEQMAELEAIYNRQQQLPMGDENADES